jgi:hypothetical protein
MPADENSQREYRAVGKSRHDDQICPLISVALRATDFAANRRAMMSDEICRYPEVIRARTPKELREAVDRAANRELTTTSAYARRALINQLRADGIAVTLIPHEDS